jgi:hypothetical protein
MRLVTPTRMGKRDKKKELLEDIRELECTDEGQWLVDEERCGRQT